MYNCRKKELCLADFHYNLISEGKALKNQFHWLLGEFNFTRSDS